MYSRVSGECFHAIELSLDMNLYIKLSNADFRIFQILEIKNVAAIEFNVNLQISIAYHVNEIKKNH